MARQRPPMPSSDHELLAGPVRMCVGCRERAPKKTLVRVTIGRDAHGQPAVVPDPLGTAPGRGAHLHPDSGCLASAVRRRAFPRALRSGVGLATEPVGEYLSMLDAPRSTRHGAASDIQAGPTRDRSSSS